MTSATLNVAATPPGPPNNRRSGGANVGRSVSALMYASQQADVDKVRKIIRDQPETLQLRDRTGKTPLHYCSTSDNICAAQAADLLVMAAPELVDKKDEDGFTPLHLAVIAGNLPLVTFLLANKADVKAVDNEKHTVVHWATVCGETAALSAVLAAGAPVSTPDIHGGYPLHYAAQMCGGEKDASLGLQVLHTLLTHTDIRISVEDGDGRQPLLWAASAGSAKAVLALIRAGASIEAPDKDGLTALHCAASRGHTDVIDSLLTLCGASADVIDSNGCTALHYAVTLGHADATALLLAHGANADRQDRKGRSPAHCGCAKGQFETVKMLASHGGNLWLKNARGDLPLHEAAASGRRDLVRWLLDMRPSQVNARNNDGRCPLHLAALNDNVDMCKILMDSGAQINPILRTSKNSFMTPLDCALQRGFRSTAKYLQLHGGVPASRVGDLRTGRSSNVNLQIRDDVTFWGDTSSDSERENGQIDQHHQHQKSSQRVQRRKIAQKMSDKRKMSNSDLDNKRKMSEKYRRGKPSGGISDSAGSSIDFSNKRKSSQKMGRFDYSNEIVINGKTEINIHQSRQISIEENSDSVSKNVESKNFEDLKVGSNEEIKKEKRPKSAKTERAVSIKTKEEEDSARKKTKPEVKLKSPKNIETNKDKTVENKKNEELLPDQQSLMSNTSEDVEGHQNLIVEAAIHPPPKNDVKEVKEMGVQWEEDVDGKNGEKENEKTINKESVKVEKEENLVTKSEDKENKIQEKSEEEINMKKVEESKEKDVEDKILDNDVKNLENQIKEDKEIVLETKEKSEENEETVNIKVEDQKVLLEEKIDDKVEVIEQILKEKEEEKKQQKEESEETVLKKDLQIVESKISDKNLSESDFQDVEKSNKEELNLEMSQTEENFPNSAKTEEVDNSIIKEDHKKEKKQKKERQKAESSAAYEIIYKTLAENESDPTKKKPTSTSSSVDTDSSSSSSSSSTIQEHKSFRILNETEAKQIESTKPKKKKKPFLKKQRSKSLEKKPNLQKSKIPTLQQTHLSKSEKYLNLPERTTTTTKSNLESTTKVPSLPNIYTNKEKNEQHIRCESNMSAPPLASINSDNEMGSASEIEDKLSSAAGRKKKLKKRSKSRPARSAGSDYESSNVIDSGFEPSPRSSRIPKWRNVSERGVNMTSVTQSIQTNIRRYHLERKIFQHLLDLKRMQIRAGQHNEAILVKRAIDMYHQSCAATVGAGRYIPEDYTFRSFEKFLYLSLRKLQRNGADHLKGLPESPSNPLLCTQSTHRCLHATHAYTGIPCAAYLPKMDHHTIPKIGFTQCKPGTAGFLPTINQKKAVTLELCHGNDKQLISLPADQLDQNKRYYVTFTVKGGNEEPENGKEKQQDGHTHSKSD